MTNIHKINEFIENNNIKNELTSNFERLLKNTSKKELDITEKNICIDLENIEYKKTEFNFHFFQSSILKNHNKIGYYALIYDDNMNLTDELFVITC